MATDWTEFEAVDSPENKVDWSEFEPFTPKDFGGQKPLTSREGERIDFLASHGVPVADESASELLLRPEFPIPRIEGKSTLGKISAAPVNVASGFIESMETPALMPLAPLAAVPVVGPAIRAALGGAFSMLAAREGGRDLGEASVTGDLQKGIEGGLQIVASPFIAKGGYNKGKPAIVQPSPESSAAILETPKETAPPLTAEVRPLVGERTPPVAPAASPTTSVEAPAQPELVPTQETKAPALNQLRAKVSALEEEARKLSDARDDAETAEEVGALDEKINANQTEIESATVQLSEIERAAISESKPIQKYRLGNNPQTFTLVEKVPQSEIERANNEQPVKVRNDKTGKEELVLETELTPVKERTAEERETGKPMSKKELQNELLRMGMEPIQFPDVASMRAALKRAKAKGAETPIEQRGAAGGNVGLNAVFDPANWTHAIEFGKALYGKVKDFAAWSARMVSEFGEVIRQHLEKIHGFVKSGFEEARADAGKESTRSTAGDLSVNPITRILGPTIKSAFEFVKDVAREESKIKRTSDLRRSVLNWSGKLQTSFNEAAQLKDDISKKVPNPVRQEGITNWIQANGDKAVLANRVVLSKDPKLRAGYEAALTLTPEEIAVANQVKAVFDTLGKRGQKYGVLNSFRDNYTPQIWDLKKGPAGAGGMGGSRMLKDRFRFSKARTFDSFFDGEQAGYVPKTKKIGDLVPVYSHEMNSVIASRQLVEQMSGGVAEDGRPLIIPKGVGIPIQGDEGGATLVIPRATKTPKGAEFDVGDYKVLENHPALTDWKWASSDTAGKPVLLKADLALHPEAYKRLKNILGRSAIREWYEGRTSALAQIPKVLVKGLDMANVETKRTMLGLLAPFHQVQEGTHGVGHKVSPFKVPRIDLVKDAGQRDAANHGVMLQPDRVSAEQFMEGFRHSGIVSKIPVVGKVADFYAHYLFHDYIPGLKYKTYQAALARNMKRYAGEMSRGEAKPEDVKILTAEQVNAAYGHLNYADLGRNPTLQHMAQLGALAPDFLEARGRFLGQSLKGATGAKVGREQLVALGTLAVAQAALAYTSAKLTGGEWDWKHPFEFHVGNRRFTMRSVPEDTFRLLTDTRAFVHGRLSPLAGKGAVQLLSGVDWRGKKVSAGETLKELAQQPIPLTLRPLFGVGNTPLSGWEQLAGSAGLKISRYHPSQDVRNQAHEWMKSSSDPKVKRQAENIEKSVFPDSPYKPLRMALEENSVEKIKGEVQKMIAEESTDKARQKRMKGILREFQPFSGDHIKPFATHSLEQEKLFRKSLDEDGKRKYRAAIIESVQDYRKLTAALVGHPLNPPVPDAYRWALAPQRP